MRHNVPAMNDFDFFVGTWHSTHRKLKKRLAGSDDWAEFTGETRCYRLFDGAANLDEMTCPAMGFSGITLRLFDPETEHWSLYWVNSRTGTLELPPVVGRFVGGVGEFFSDEKQEGKQVRVRYRWSNITDTGARWEQAFSTDGEKTWETNWIAEFTRTGR